MLIPPSPAISTTSSSSGIVESAPQYSKFVPGQTASQHAPQLYRSTGGSARPAAALVGINAEQAIARGLMFAGNPDTVYRQIMDFQAKAGRFELLVLASRSGFITHAEAEKGLNLFAKEVLPRLQEIAP